MKILDKEYIEKDDLKNILTDLYYLNENDLSRSQLLGLYKEEFFHRGILSCLGMLNDYYRLNLKFDIDNL